MVGSGVWCFFFFFGGNLVSGFFDLFRGRFFCCVEVGVAVWRVFVVMEFYCRKIVVSGSSTFRTRLD